MDKIRYRKFIIEYVDDRYDVCPIDMYTEDKLNNDYFEANTVQEAKRFIDDYWNKNDLKIESYNLRSDNKMIINESDYDYDTYPDHPNILNLTDWYMDQGMDEDDATTYARSDLGLPLYNDIDNYEEYEEATNISNINTDKRSAVDIISDEELEINDNGEIVVDNNDKENKDNRVILNELDNDTSDIVYSENSVKIKTKYRKGMIGLVDAINKVIDTDDCLTFNTVEEIAKWLMDEDKIEDMKNTEEATEE